MNAELLLLLEKEKARQSGLTDFERAMEAAQQRRSWVIGEMRLSNETLSYGQANDRYIQICPEGALLQALELLRSQGYIDAHGKMVPYK